MGSTLIFIFCLVDLNYIHQITFWIYAVMIQYTKFFNKYSPTNTHQNNESACTYEFEVVMLGYNVCYCDVITHTWQSLWRHHTCIATYHQRKTSNWSWWHWMIPVIVLLQRWHTLYVLLVSSKIVLLPKSHKAPGVGLFLTLKFWL